MYKEQREKNLNKTIKKNSKPQGESSREEERNRGKQLTKRQIVHTYQLLL